MQSQALATMHESHSTPCEPPKRNSLLRHWLALFALNAGQPLDADALSVYVALWVEGFADLSDDVLEAAFRKTLATCKFWPVKIADVREHVECADDSRIEDEWLAAMEAVSRWYYPDLSPSWRGPRLPADVDHAIRAAGGYAYLESCSRDDWPFAKNRFIEDLTRQRKSGDVARFLPSSEVRKTLEVAAVGFALPQISESLPNRRIQHGEAFSRPLLRNAQRVADLAALIRQGEAIWRAARAEPRLPEPMVAPK